VATADVYTEPVGFYKVTAPTNTDTYINVPFTQIPAAQGLIASASGSTIGASNSPGWTPGQFAVTTTTADGNTYFSHYVYINTGSKAGATYAITNNDASSLFVTLAPEDLTSVAAGDQFRIVPYWTLGTIWPGGTGVVASTSSVASGRRSQILFPDLVSTGINLSAAGTYYFFNSAWRKQGSNASSNFNNVAILPDQYVTQRQATNAADTSTVTTLGQVVLGKTRIPFYANGLGSPTAQDNFVGLYRPAVQTLNETGITNAFVASISSVASGRRDQLLQLDYGVGLNKSAIATYYYFNNGWRKQGVAATVDYGTSNNIVTPTTGFILRKQTNTVDAIWVNSANYTN
jgi:uncharacterized protein (TIGR02597 family)